MEGYGEGESARQVEGEERVVSLLPSSEVRS
jgi:hypothetical protein